MGMTLDDKLYQAEELGKHAMSAGKARVFAIDRRANRLIAGGEIKDGTDIAIMKAWYKGWDDQSAKAEG